jgi:alkanesulfonate monooxygenase SsuD/methylene tetrahydromethanopterin reductase-like flavin-dependent oxidoreductase (luciferase family)
MRFGLFTAHDRTLDEARALWRRVEAAGFDAVGVVDSPLLMREALVSLAALALDTERIRIFPSVMNTLTRDPTVVAGAALALRDLAGERAFLAFGSGDSSTHGVGLGTARLDHMGEYVGAVRALLAGEEARYQGRAMRGAWHGFAPLSVPLFLSAHGPRALALAGRVADGVICGFGLLPETIARAEAIVRDAAEGAGRDPAAIEIWHVAYYCPADTIEEGFLHANGAGAAVLARSGLAGKLVPDHLVDAVRAVGETWQLDRHGRANEHTLAVARATGCLDYLVARGGGLVGPVDAAAAIAELGERGVENVLFVALGADKPALVDGLGAAIGAVKSTHRLLGPRMTTLGT